MDKRNKTRGIERIRQLRCLTHRGRWVDRSIIVAENSVRQTPENVCDQEIDGGIFLGTKLWSPVLRRREIEMAETVKKQIKVLVIGTDHNIQRRQDTNPDLGPIRDQLEKRVRQIIEEQKVDLIAEETGDDTEVWKRLIQEEEALGKFAEAFGGGKTVDHPVSTIAKQIADERPGELRHVDIRAPNAEKLSIDGRDAAMTAKIMEILGDADSVVVIVGEDHRAGVAQRLKAKGMSVACMRFPE